MPLPRRGPPGVLQVSARFDFAQRASSCKAHGKRHPERSRRMPLGQAQDLTVPTGSYLLDHAQPSAQLAGSVGVWPEGSYTSTHPSGTTCRAPGGGALRLRSARLEMQCPGKGHPERSPSLRSGYYRGMPLRQVRDFLGPLPGGDYTTRRPRRSWRDRSGSVRTDRTRRRTSPLRRNHRSNGRRSSAD